MAVVMLDEVKENSPAWFATPLVREEAAMEEVISLLPDATAQFQP